MCVRPVRVLRDRGFQSPAAFDLTPRPSLKGRELESSLRDPYRVLCDP